MSKWYHNTPYGPGSDLLRRNTSKDVYRITGIDPHAVGGPRRFDRTYRTAAEVISALGILDQIGVEGITITHLYRKAWREMSREALAKKEAKQ